MYLNSQLPETLGAGTNATAVGIITNNGYLVEIELEPYRIVRARPNIYYVFPGCTGTAYVGSLVETSWKEYQGYVYSLRGSEALYYVPRGSRVSRPGTFQSTRTGFGGCISTQISNVDYAVATLPNDPAVTGVDGAATRGGLVFGVPF
jgi:hypothetical protein